jgi:hypothetical protein
MPRSLAGAWLRAVIFSGFFLPHLFAGPAGATSPDLLQCTWNQRIGRSPKNLEVGDPAFQYVLNGVLRDFQGVPIDHYPASFIELEIGDACGNPVILNPDADSDFMGAIQWGAAKLDQGGGACFGQAVAVIRIIGVGVARSYDRVMSPDGNGDGLIGLQDLGTFQQSFFTQTNPQYGDLNLDGVIDLRDLGFFQRHFTAP